MASVATDKKMQQLLAIIDTGDSDAIKPVVMKALTDKSNFLVAKAAGWCAEALCYEAIPNLVSAYQRFVTKPLVNDKTCAAKRAIARALFELDYDNENFYRQGISYHQREPVYGGYNDSAIELRCTCAMGIAASSDYRMMLDLIQLLHDHEYQARIGAIKAMEMAQPYQAELALRFKILQGDDEPEVIAQAFSSLLKIDLDQSLDFVTAYVQDQTLEKSDRESNLKISDSNPAKKHRISVTSYHYQAAAIALGESRSEIALAVLVREAKLLSQYHPYRQVMYQAIALSGLHAGIEYLLSELEQGDLDAAGHAIEALSIYNYRPELKRNVSKLVDFRRTASLGDRFHRLWN